jgi:two-component system phosphate regulon response regulator PhoB
MAGSKMAARILIVEDESAIAEVVAMNLRHGGYETEVAASAESARGALNQVLPDLILLDWMLPGQSGVGLLRQLRADARTKHLPIIMLTARQEESDMVAGLDAGADDYLTKPFSVNELLARIRALLRRKAPESLDSIINIGHLQLDPLTRSVCCKAIPVKLGPSEFRLLHYFVNHPGRIHSRAMLLDRVWGDHVFIEERTVDVQIKRLREGLATADCAHIIETIRGVGYRLNPSALSA